jgi:hypothetical protein
MNSKDTTFRLRVLKSAGRFEIPCRMHPVSYFTHSEFSLIKFALKSYSTLINYLHLSISSVTSASIIIIGRVTCLTHKVILDGLNKSVKFESMKHSSFYYITCLRCTCQTAEESTRGKITQCTQQQCLLIWGILWFKF